MRGSIFNAVGTSLISFKAVVQGHVCVFATSPPIPLYFTGAAQEENLIPCLLPLPAPVFHTFLCKARLAPECLRDEPKEGVRRWVFSAVVLSRRAGAGWILHVPLCLWPLTFPGPLHHRPFRGPGDAGGVPERLFFRATHEAAGQSRGQSLDGPFKCRNSSAFSCSNCSLTASGFWQFLAALSVMYCQDFNKGLPQTYLLLQLRRTPQPRGGQGLDCGGVQGWGNCSFGGLFPV